MSVLYSYKIKTNQNRSRLISLVFLLIPLFLAGCFYSVHNFGEQLNSLNTDLDRELRNANHSNDCFTPSLYKTFNKERFASPVEELMSKTFLHFFPLSTPLKQITERLKLEGGAKCTTQIDATNNNVTHTVCTYSHEYVQGMKDLGLTGWKILSAQWQKDNYEFKITAQGGLLVDVEGKVLGGECYEIDKGVYEESNTIKFMRKL